MRIDRHFFRLALCVVLFSLTMAVIVFLLFKGRYSLAFYLLVPCLYLLKKGVDYYNMIDEKITLLCQAIENDDYTFYFPEGTRKKILTNDLNVKLNRMRQFLWKVKINTIQKEKYYEQIIEMVNVGILVTNERGGIYQVNKMALRQLGMEVLTDICQLDRVSEGLSARFSSMHHKEKIVVVYPTEKGNNCFSVVLSVMEMKGRSLNVYVINNINNELEEKEADSWIALVRVMTHEIMNSVAPIASLTETLLNSPECDGELKSGLEVIHSTSENLISFISTYRRFTRLPVPHRSAFYVKAFFERMLLMIKNEPGGKLLSCSYDLSDDELLLYADEGQITQVVFNLMKNALQAIQTDLKRGAILLKAYCTEEEQICIEVQDNGSGISPEMQKQIFVPFFTTKPNGSGIGLSLSRQIMRLHQGSLSLKKSVPGETVFLLVFN